MERADEWDPAGVVGGSAVRNMLSHVGAGNIVQAGSIGSLTINARESSLTPHQLPLAQEGFVNRLAELAVLDGLVGRSDLGAGPTVAVLTGLGGVGKTALGTHWARAYLDRFPDGQLYTDLSQVRHDGAVDIGGVLGTILRSLRVANEAIPASLAERAAQFRSVTAGRRLLLFIDNAEHAAEVRSLLPAAGLVVVTSRKRLPALVMDGARLLSLRPLDADAGAKLVRHWVGDGRGGDEEVAELVQLCGGLPLALRAVGARLIGRQQLTVGRVVSQLTDERNRLELVADRDGGGVDEVFDAVYESLPGHTRALYHLVGIHPGPTFSAELATAVGVDRLADALDDLREAHLIEELAGEGAERYHCHDLVRLHARRCAVRREDETTRTETLRRIVHYYRARARAADLLVLGQRMRLPEDGGPGYGGSVPGFADRAEALGWLDAERTDLLAVVRAAAAQGWHDAVWRLCESLWALYNSRKHHADWIESHQLGVEAAQWEGRRDAEIRMRNQLARAYRELGDLDRAEGELRRAEELLPLVDDPRLSGVVQESLGLVRLDQGDAGAAVLLFTRAKDANAGDAHGTVVQGYNLGQALLAAGRLPEALAVLRQALATARTAGDDPMKPRVQLVLARVHRQLGHQAQAVRCLTSAERAFAGMGQHVKRLKAVELLALIADEAGDEPRADGLRRTMAAISAELGLPAA